MLKFLYDIGIAIASSLISGAMLFFLRSQYKKLKVRSELRLPNPKRMITTIQSIFLQQQIAGVLLILFRSYFLSNAISTILWAASTFLCFATVSYLFFFITTLYKHEMLIEEMLERLK